jgi:hypothetical protein
MHQFSLKKKLQLCQELLKLLLLRLFKKFLLNLNKTVPQFRESGMR